MDDPVAGTLTGRSPAPGRPVLRPGQESWLKEAIRDVPDFPQPGVVFKDLSPLLADPERFRLMVAALSEALAAEGPADRVVAIEARGFILGAAVAYRLRAGFTAVRKQGKLPSSVVGEAYSLEYGDDHLEVQADAMAPGDRVLIVDDVLATGGTAEAASRLVERLGATVSALGFGLELGFLDGRSRLEGRSVVSVLQVD